MVQKVKDVSNVLLLKAAKPEFDETNLTVITADGKLYSFLVNYAENPVSYLIRIENPYGKTEPEVLFSNENGKEAHTIQVAEKLAKQKAFINHKKDKKYGIEISLEGVYVKDNLMYLQFKLQNYADIGYDIEQFRLTILDQQKSKRTAIQQMELNPVAIYGDTKMIKERSAQRIIFALPKFTIPDMKYLQVQLMEQNGGRHLSLKIRNPTIVRAKPLQQLF
ncbi:hypothetical protein D3C80_1229370 [compost metagenome]